MSINTLWLRNNTSGDGRIFGL